MFFINKYMKYSVKSILFLGVGGISMHQLAIAMKKMGIKVFGFDLHKNKYTELCKNKGVEITHKFNKKFCEVDLCVKTAAIKDGKFLDYLNEQQIPILDRAEILGWLCSKFKQVIAVAGTHGKSTTASLIYEILTAAGEKVSCHIGAEVENFRFETGDDFLVVEACEFNKSFLKINPTISVVTNIEKEHLDSYGNFFNLKSAFLSFLKRGDKRFVFMDKSTQFLKKYNNIAFVEKTKMKINPQIKGDYNFNNISLAVAVCESLGVKDKTIKETVENFKGIPRRYELLGEYKSSKIYIDYAHHPTEVKAFFETFKNENKNSQIIFQPHTFSRTKNFLKDFVKVLSSIENLIIFKEYAARETFKDGLSAKQLYEEIRKINPNVKYVESQKELTKNIKQGYAVAFVGAGNIDVIAKKLVCKK